MTQAGSEVEYTPADQFNHAVAAVRSPDGKLSLLDPTWSPKSRELWSSRECLQHVVYGVPEGRDLGRSPYFPPEHNRMTCSAKGEIDETGRLSTSMTFGLSNYPCTSFRRHVSRVRPSLQRGRIEGALDRLGSQVRLGRLEHSNVYDYTRDSEIALSAEVDHHALIGKDAHYFKLPMLLHPLGDIWAGDVLQKVDKKKDRKHGMRLRTTRLLEYSDELAIPEGWAVTDLPESVAISNDAADLRFDVSHEGRVIRYSLHLAVKRHIVPAEEYDDYQVVNEKLLELADSWVRCTPPADKEKPVVSGSRIGEDSTR
jgi:hypothetical protein